MKLFALTTACGAVARTEWSGTLLAEIQARTQSRSGIVRLKVSDFPPLANDFGSVRVGTSSLNGDFPRGIFYPLLINRGPGNQFYALSAECTHEGCVVRPYSRTLNASQCPCHQSRFRIDGSFINGSGPAFFPLTRYPLTFDGTDRLTIEVPDFSHEITGVVLPTSTQPRVRLEFFAYLGMEFEILFRESLNDLWKAISFSTTPGGVASQNVVTGNDRTTVVYVDRSAATGFYAVSIRVRQV